VERNLCGLHAIRGLGFAMKASEIIALFMSGGALLVSIISMRFSLRAEKIGHLNKRLEAINCVREAVGDVALQGVVNAQTAATLREAFQLSRVVFKPSVHDTLEKLYRIAFRLQHKPTERYTDQDETDKEFLMSELGNVLERMRSEAAISS
jgi:hypothetical protein